MGRRGPDDEKWSAVKEIVFSRDNNKDRILKRLTAGQVLTLRKKAGPQLAKLDPAHIFPVSTHAEIMYAADNIVLLNRYSHTMLDSFRDPVTGASISLEDVYDWWEQIAGKKQWERLIKLNEGEEYGRESGESSS